MALAMQGFSIREYAARMRSVDVAKCWPFDEANEADVRAALPPMTIKKFRWWFDELKLADGNNKAEEDDDQEEESDLEETTLECLRRMKRVRKGKSVKVVKVVKSKKAKPKVKAPKKRSIVELFAVAPQVDRLNSDDDENGECSDDGEDGDEGSGEEAGIVDAGLRKRKVKKKGILSMLKKEKTVMIKNLKNKDGVNKKKKMEKGKNAAVELRSPKKEKTSKLKLQTSANSVANANCSTYSKDLFEAIAAHVKKPRLKRLTKEKMKCKTPSTSKLLQNDQQAVSPVRGILKNHRRVIPAENSTDSIFYDAGILTNSSTQTVNKHVSFSRSDDVLELKRKAYPTVELETQTFSDSTSDISAASVEKGHPSERGKSLSIQEMKETELGISNSAAAEADVQLMTENLLSGRYHEADAPNFFSRQHGFSQGNWLNRSVSFGQGPLHIESPQWLKGCNRVTACDALYTSSSGIPSLSQERNIPKFTVPMYGYLSDASSSSRRLLDLSGDAGPDLDSSCSMDCLKAYPQPVSSYFSIQHENANARPLFSSQSIRENHNDHAFPYQWFPHLSPKELMHTICSLPDWNSRVAMCGEIGISENFIGLPLNSQGEFISLNSSGKDCLNPLKSMSTLRGPSLSSPMHENILSNSIINHIDIRSWNGMAPFKNQVQSCRIKDSGKEAANCDLPSGFDMFDQYGTGRTNTVMKGSDPDLYSLESDMDRMKVSQFEPRHNYEVQKHPRDEIIQQHGNSDHISVHVTQSTMRLMGQEFTIGGRGFEGLEDRELWMDKQIITDCSNNNGIETSSIKSPHMPEFIVHPILGKLKGTATYVSEAEMKQAAEGAPPMMVPESKTSLHFSDSHNNVMQQHWDGLSKGILKPEKYPQFSLVSSLLSDSHKSTLENKFSCSYISPVERPGVSIPGSTLLNCSENMSRSRAQLENKHTSVPPAQLALKFPFSHSECGMHTEPSWSQNSFRVMHPGFLETRKKASLMGYRQSHSGPGTVCHPCSMSGINFQTGPSSFPRPEPFLLFPSSGSENAFASTSLVHCPSVPTHPGFSSNSSMQNRVGEKVNFGSQVESGFSVRIPAHGKRSKKRVPSVSGDCVRSSKIPKIGIQEDSSCAVTAVQSANNFQGDAGCDRQVLELGSAEENAVTVECGHNGIHVDELGDCTETGPFKLTGAPRSGPMKLTAGARYILKPCQKNDQANSKSTNSIIPVATPATGRRVLGSEKSSKIYRF